MTKTTWELDFYSRPILDGNQKKIWEVLICESSTQPNTNLANLFRFVKDCPSSMVNSLWLREAIEQAIAEAGITPSRIRFFRRQMNNMIVKACEDAGIPPVPSRRTHDLNHWLNKRSQAVYPNHPGYDEQSANQASVQYPPLDPVPLPDAVRGDRQDKWSFVTLPAVALMEMGEWDIAFGDAFSLTLAEVSPDTPIPGLIIFSRRALPLAGWLSGLELAYIAFNDAFRPIIRLETGASDSWILVNLRDETTLKNAQSFETLKLNAQNIHFLAVQTNTETESFAGFWLLKEP